MLFQLLLLVDQMSFETTWALMYSSFSGSSSWSSLVWASYFGECSLGLLVLLNGHPGKDTLFFYLQHGKKDFIGFPLMDVLEFIASSMMTHVSYFICCATSTVLFCVGVMNLWSSCKDHRSFVVLLLHWLKCHPQHPGCRWCLGHTIHIWCHEVLFQGICSLLPFSVFYSSWE